MPTISVIVPIYNVEHYLSACIDSVLDQTFTDFELILVNDGSTDRCGEICDHYATKDKWIKIIHQDNKGVSAARIVGIDNAKGKYIAFVDPDDTTVPNMYRHLLDSAKRYDVEITVCPIKIVNGINGSIHVSSIWMDTNCKLNNKMIIEVG